MVFQHCSQHNLGGGEILTFVPDDSHSYSGVRISMVRFNTVGGEILTFPDTPTTQGLSLWCFNTVPVPRPWPRSAPQAPAQAHSPHTAQSNTLTHTLPCISR